MTSPDTDWLTRLKASLTGLLPHLDSATIGWILLTTIVVVLLLVILRMTTAKVSTVQRKRPVNTLQDLSLFEGLPDTKTMDIDPVAEAEVYVAYGNKQQAINLLRRAAEMYPQRADIRNKLAEIEAL